MSEEELLTHLWPRLYVTPTVLRVCVHAIRHALQDNPVAPQFLETVGRQGYRFIGAVRAPSSPVSTQAPDARERAASPTPVIQPTPPSPPPFVGRAQELARLHAAFAQAQQGAR